MSSTHLRPLLLFAVVCLTSACATTPMGQPTASVDNIRLAKSSGIQPVAVGTFQSAQGKEEMLERPLAIRATRLTAPGETFAGYLKETLEAELTGAGLLDTAAPLKIEGILTERQVDAGMGQGSASLSARFIVRRDDKQLYDRELGVKSTWESSFVGAIAIPAAINEFTLLHRKLVSRLLSDPEFVSSVKKQ
jgi:hypothetical protein